MATKVRKAILEGRRIKPPAMSDEESYLRVGIPDGLRTDGTYPIVCGVVQDVAGPKHVEPVAHNPLTKSGKKVLASMKSEYGSKKGKEVFYASINKGKKGSKKWHR